VHLKLPHGAYDALLRSGSGTVIYARSTLSLSGAGPLVVQVSEGRVPELSGEGGSLSPNSKN
jgi:hypothetical protein